MNYHEQYDAYLARAKRALEEACRRYHRSARRPATA